MSASRTRRLLAFALPAASLALSLVAAELLLRTFYSVDYYKPVERRSKRAWKHLLHQPSPVPGLAYELAPKRSLRTRGTLFRTNSFGMRDDEPRTAGGEAPRRIVVLGDSFTFGFSVPGESTYPNVLERLLDDEAGAGRFEVLNFGVGGYSTRDEALVLEHKALGWNPELVVVGYVLNDPETGSLQPLQRYFREPAWWQRFELCRLAASFEFSLEVALLGHGDYYRYLHARQRKWQSVVDGFATIGRLSSARRIPVLVMIFPMTGEPWPSYPYTDLHAQVAQAARDHQLEVLDLYEAFSQFPAERLMVAPGDEHPNQLGHEIAARAVQQWWHRHQAALPRP